VTPLAELEQLLRPAGGGLYAVSTGREAQEQLQRAIYGVDDVRQVVPAWQRELASLSAARVAVLGVPSDCGAGLERGAAFAPRALRAAVLAARPDFRAWSERHGIVDVGDVAVVPQLLHDEMLSEGQKLTSRAALYPALPAAEAAGLPVAPLSIAERVIERLFDLNPGLRLFVLGGDHSVAWPVVSGLARRRAEPFAIVQPDAHTDLLPDRLGVKYCFATWAFHANELIGRDGRLVQVGVRASTRPREHWETSLGVKQFWAREVVERGEAETLEAIVAHLRGRGVRHVYFSNDIDGTDAAYAPATGAPEPGGLTPGFVRALVARLGEAFTLIGADLVEVAPPLGPPEGSRRTLEVGASYVLASLEALVKSTDA
jgi:arginase family enzyme